MLADLFTKRGDARLVKASPADEPPAAPKAFTLDPEMVSAHYAGDLPTSMHPGTGGLDYASLLAMARVPMIGAIMQTRINQVAEFASRHPTPFTLGYKVRHRDKGKSVTKAMERRAAEIEDIIERAGGKYGPGGFEPTLRMLVRDSLTFDQATFEVFGRGPRSINGQRRKREPWGFAPVDAMSIRRARPSDKAIREGRWDIDELAYCQIVDYKVVEHFTADEMAFGIRRPRSQLWVNGYGYPELEELIVTVTNLLNAETWNSVAFTQGMHASTILAVKSSMGDDKWRAFTRNVRAMLSGVRNARKTPIVQLDPNDKEDITEIKLSSSNKDMEYTEWIRWLMKLTCAVFCMDPAELAFVMGNEGQTSSLNSASPTARIEASKERGLRPLLRCIAQWLTRSIVQAVDPEYVFEFVGYDSMSQAERADLNKKAVSTYRTVNELRQEEGLEPIDNPAADMILDPQYTQVALSQMGGDEEPEGGEGQGGEGYGGPDDDSAWGGQDYGGDLRLLRDVPGDEAVAKGGLTDRLTRALAETVERQLTAGDWEHDRRSFQKGRPWAPSRSRAGAKPGQRYRTFVAEVERP